MNPDVVERVSLRYARRITDGLWRRQFGADPHVLGRRILVDEDGYTIVGVMPPDFRHPGQGLTADRGIVPAAGFKANPFPMPLRAHSDICPARSDV